LLATFAIFVSMAADMWLRRALLRLSIKTKRPKFREIHWNDDGEVRPVTRGKAKQFGFEEASPTAMLMGSAPYRMRSNVSCSSQTPLTGNPGMFSDKETQRRIRYFSSFSRS
jgi:hypothetical protein